MNVTFNDVDTITIVLTAPELAVIAAGAPGGAIAETFEEAARRYLGEADYNARSRLAGAWDRSAKTMPIAEVLEELEALP
jgi:hypothetical protein